jgi:oligopeptide transport system substrate-binding protein
LEENREKARALLAAAGFPGGKGLPPLNLIFSTGQDTVRIAEVIQQQWREALGVEIVLNNLERQTYFQMRKEGNFDLCFFGWTGDFVDPETFLGLWISGAGTNYARWQNPAYDDHIASANHSGPERMKRLQEAEKILLQEFPIIPLYFGATQFLKDPRLQGWYPNLLDQHPLRAVYWQE